MIACSIKIVDCSEIFRRLNENFGKIFDTKKPRKITFFKQPIWDIDRFPVRHVWFDRIVFWIQEGPKGDFRSHQTF